MNAFVGLRVFICGINYTVSKMAQLKRCISMDMHLFSKSFIFYDIQTLEKLQIYTHAMPYIEFLILKYLYGGVLNDILQVDYITRFAQRKLKYPLLYGMIGLCHQEFQYQTLLQ